MAHFDLFSEEDVAFQLMLAIKDLRNSLEYQEPPATSPATPELKHVYLQPDMSALTSVLAGIKASVPADELAEAMRAALPNLDPMLHPVWGEMVSTLERLEFRMQAQAYGGGSVSLAPNQVLKIEKGTAATVTSVASSATSVTILAENGLRHSAHLFNDSTSALFVKFGATASITSFTHKVVPSGSLDIPYPAYVGLMTGIWTSADGFARLTEVTV